MKTLIRYISEYISEYMSYCCRPKIKKHDLVNNTVGQKFDHKFPFVGEVDPLGNFVDQNLVNPWGIVIYGENIYVNANGSDILIRYDLCGNNPYYINLCDENGTTLSNTTTPDGVFTKSTM